MKILLIHSYYQLRGGEDAVFEQEYALLKKEHDVQKISFQNKGGLKGALQFGFSAWNISASQRVRAAIKECAPDIVHIHNWHFASGPIIIRTAKKMGIPVVMTLHNYRLLCPSATLLENGKIFLASLQTKFPWQAVKKKVYRNSLLLTFWLAFVIWFHKLIGTWQLVDRYIALTGSGRSVFVDSNIHISADRIVVKPNFVEPPYFYSEHKEDYFVFVGRLSEEKGIRLLLSAFKKSNYRLKILGDGPLAYEVIEACSHAKNIEWLGHLKKHDVIQTIKKSTALIFPSIWFETFGLVLVESLALGTPLIAANIGSASEIVKDAINGLHFEAGNSDSLLEKLQYWHQLSNSEKETYSLNARHSYISLYTPEQNLKQLTDIYQSLIVA